MVQMAMADIESGTVVYFPTALCDTAGTDDYYSNVVIFPIIPFRMDIPRHATGLLPGQVVLCDADGCVRPVLHETGEEVYESSDSDHAA